MQESPTLQNIKLGQDNDNGPEMDVSKCLQRVSNIGFQPLDGINYLFYIEHLEEGPRP